MVGPYIKLQQVSGITGGTGYGRQQRPEKTVAGPGVVNLQIPAR